jgi:hypothetical protein
MKIILIHLVICSILAIIFSKGLCPALKCNEHMALQNGTCYIPLSQNDIPYKVAVSRCPTGQLCNPNPYDFSSLGAPWIMGGDTKSCGSAYDYLLFSTNPQGQYVERDPCTYNTDCAGNSYCEDGFCKGIPRGAACTTYKECSSYDYCGDDGFCTKRKGAGQPCTIGNDWECKESYFCGYDSTCVKQYSLPAGANTTLDRLCHSGYQYQEVCEELILLNENGRCNYTENSACNYLTSVSKTLYPLGASCYCNPDGSGNDLCRLGTDSPQRNAFIEVSDKSCSFGCPYDNSCYCNKIPTSVFDEVTIAEYALKQFDFNNFPCMKFNLYNQEPEDRHKIVSQLEELEQEVSSSSSIDESSFLNEIHELVFDENIDPETTENH